MYPIARMLVACIVWPGKHSKCPINSGLGWPFDQSNFHHYFALCVPGITWTLGLAFQLTVSTGPQLTKTVSNSKLALVELWYGLGLGPGLGLGLGVSIGFRGGFMAYRWV